MTVMRKDFIEGSPGDSALAASHLAMNRWLEANTVTLLNVETLIDVGSTGVSNGHGRGVYTLIRGVRLWYTPCSS